MEPIKKRIPLLLICPVVIFLSCTLLLPPLCSGSDDSEWQVIVEDEPQQIPTSPAGPQKTITTPSQAAVSMQATPQKAAPGSIVTITIQVPGSIKSNIGRVDINCPDGTFIASASGSEYRYFWQIPKHLKKSVQITCTVLAKKKDPHGRAIVIASGATLVEIINLSLSFRAERYTHPLSKPSRFEAVIRGGTPPYACTWFLGGPSKTGKVTKSGIKIYSSTMVHTWKRTGRYRVGVTFTDANGFTRTREATINIHDLSLVAGISAQQTRPKEDVAVTMQASGGKGPYVFTLDCGNQGASPGISAPGMNAVRQTCSYAKPGLYRIEASVTDAYNTRDFKAFGVRVKGGFLMLLNGGYHEAGEDVKLTVYIHYLVAPFTLNVTWGHDGSEKISGIYNKTHYFHHVFKKAGKYAIQVTAKDAEDALASAGMTIAVEKKDPPCKCRSNEVNCGSGLCCSPKDFPCWNMPAIKKAIKNGKCRGICE